MDVRNRKSNPLVRWAGGLRAGFAALAAAAVFGIAGAALAQTPAPGPTATAPVVAATETPAPAVTPAATPAAAPAAAGVIKAAAPTVNKGDDTWMLISTALVLVMTVPGLGLFYGGLVRSKNMLSILMQVATVTVIGMLMWAIVGYSLAFTDGGSMNMFVGGVSKFFLNGTQAVAPEASPDGFSLAATFSTGVYIHEIIFVCFQMTFACITACLVIGALAERVKFIGIVVFAIIWPLLVYYPIAHMVWFWGGPDAVATHASDPVANSGFLYGKGALDFAGGTVVHINSGIAALMGCLVLGKRKGYKTEPMPPHSLTMTMIGTGLLWFGWFGFNAGSNLESNFYAGLAMTNTFLATAAAGFSWMIVEMVTRRKASLLGMCSGIVAGLVAVTPAAGFAGPMGAIVLGLIVSPVCFFAVSTIKNMLGYDDALDVFGVHCVGGIIGALGTGIVVNPALGGAGVVDYVNCSKDGAVLGACPVAPYDLATQMIAQATGVATTLAWSGVISLVIWFVLKAAGLLRVKQETEEEGLDINEHGEMAYHS
jgi:Amt family ammonium transporter